MVITMQYQHGCKYKDLYGNPGNPGVLQEFIPKNFQLKCGILFPGFPYKFLFVAMFKMTLHSRVPHITSSHTELGVHVMFAVTCDIGCNYTFCFFFFYLIDNKQGPTLTDTFCLWCPSKDLLHNKKKKNSF